MLRDYRMVGNARALAASLRRLTGHQVRFRCFAEADHITALPTSIGMAFDFMYRA
jgi:hypothetical protein